MTMNKTIAVIDYGMGNISSVMNSLQLLGAKVISSNKVEELAKADALILPGVGSFHHAVDNFNRLNLFPFLETEVLKNKKPFLGICLGMQLLAHESEEQGPTKGLGWINGKVTRMKPEANLSIPHVGWNNLTISKSGDLLKNIDEDSHFFFDHSFQFVCEDKDVITATCSYGSNIVSSLQKENIFATQFHPEKSQRNGLKILRNFINYVNNSEVIGGKDA